MLLCNHLVPKHFTTPKGSLKQLLPMPSSSPWQLLPTFCFYGSVDGKSLSFISASVGPAEPSQSQSHSLRPFLPVPSSLHAQAAGPPPCLFLFPLPFSFLGILQGVPCPVSTTPERVSWRTLPVSSHYPPYKAASQGCKVPRSTERMPHFCCEPGSLKSSHGLPLEPLHLCKGGHLALREQMSLEAHTPCPARFPSLGEAVRATSQKRFPKYESMESSLHNLFSLAEPG